MNTEEIIDGILSAEDYDEKRVIAAIKQRRANQRLIETANALATIRRGAFVQLHGLTPKYLNGLRGTVTLVDRTRATVEVEETSMKYLTLVSNGRFRNPVRVPITCLEPTAKPAEAVR